MSTVGQFLFGGWRTFASLQRRSLDLSIYILYNFPPRSLCNLPIDFFPKILYNEFRKYEREVTPMNDITKMRAVLLRQMDDYVREHCEDEDLFMYWLMDGVPDGADDEMLLDLAQIDGCWLNVVNAFGKMLKELGINPE